MMTVFKCNAANCSQELWSALEIDLCLPSRPQKSDTLIMICSVMSHRNATLPLPDGPLNGKWLGPLFAIDILQGAGVFGNCEPDMYPVCVRTNQTRDCYPDV